MAKCAVCGKGVHFGNAVSQTVVQRRCMFVLLACVLEKLKEHRD